MRKLILAMLFLMVLTAAKSQTYSTNYNAPYDITKLKVLLLIKGESIIVPATGLMTRIELGKIATIDAHATRTLFYPFHKDPATMLTTNKMGATLRMGGDFTFHFIDKLADRKTTVLLGKEYNKKYYLKVPAKVRKIYGLRGGAYFNNEPFWVQHDAALQHVAFEAKNDTTVFRDNALTMVTSTGVYVGLSTRRIDKLGINAEGWGNRRRNRQRELYADIMLGGTVLHDLVLTTGKTVEITAPKNFIGWRVGASWMDNGTYVKVEFGQRPYLSGANFMANLVFGFVLFGNEKGLKK